MFSMYSEPEQTLNIDMIDEMEYFGCSSSTLFDDLDAQWAPLKMNDYMIDDNDCSPVIAAPRPSALISFEDLEYPSSPLYYATSPTSDASSLSSCSTPSPTIDPSYLLYGSPTPSTLSWIAPKVELVETTLPFLPSCEPQTDILSEEYFCNKREYDDLEDLDDDEDVMEALSSPRVVGRKSKLFHLTSDDEDDESDETFIPEDDAPPPKRQRHSSSPRPRADSYSSIELEAAPRRAKSTSAAGCAGMHYCPIAKCKFHSERHSDVDRHFKSVHEKVRFACPVCDKKLTRRDAVKRHQEAGDACKKALRKKAKLQAQRK